MALKVPCRIRLLSHLGVVVKSERMHTAANATISATAGVAGCALPRLWQQVQEKLPQEMRHMDDGVKAHFWALIVQHPADLRIVCRVDSPAAQG